MLRDVLLSKGLSNRESEVTDLLTLGLTNKEIAARLFVTEKTVKFHLTNIYKKMNVKSRSQLIVWCSPHMSFIENDQNLPPEQVPVQSYNNMPIGQQNVANTSATYSQNVSELSTGNINSGFNGNKDGDSNF